MSNYWLLTIGINQYQNFQPLSYAQADAQALWSFCVGKAGFMPDRCLLLTDSSPFMEGQPTYPTKENLEKWIEWLCRDALVPGSPLEPGDTIWCFFCGYGVNWEGQDYLMPIDGNPADIPGTGISMRSLYERLKGSSASTVLVLLDMKHSQNSQDSSMVGVQAVALARELEISTILSCQPSQVSHEAPHLQHGLFTAALLEGLRSGAGRTLAELKQYLSEQLPSLSERNEKQRQDPVFVVHPPGKIHRTLLPPNGIAAANGNLTDNDRYAAAGALGAATLSPSLIAVQQRMQGIEETSASVQNPFQAALGNGEPSLADDFEEPASPVTSQPSNQTRPPREMDEPERDGGSFWQQMFLWTGGTLLVLLLLFIGSTWGFRQLFGVRQRPVDTVPTLSQAGDPQLPAPAANSPRQASQAQLNQAKMALHNNQVSPLAEAIQQARQIQPGEPLYQDARANIDRWSRVIFDIAQGRALRGNFTGAIAAVNLIPKDHPIYNSEAEPSLNRWQVAARQQQTNRTLLRGARALLQEGQASSYNDAIAIASKIPAGQPVYAEAQQEIGRWSQAILNLAQSRASQGDLQAAIQTAALVPENTPAHSQARQAIAQWRRQLAQPSPAQ